MKVIDVEPNPHWIREEAEEQERERLWLKINGPCRAKSKNRYCLAYRSTYGGSRVCGPHGCPRIVEDEA